MIKAQNGAGLVLKPINILCLVLAYSSTNAPFRCYTCTPMSHWPMPQSVVSHTQTAGSMGLLVPDVFYTINGQLQFGHEYPQREGNVFSRMRLSVCLPIGSPMWPLLVMHWNSTVATRCQVVERCSFDAPPSPQPIGTVMWWLLKRIELEIRWYASY